MAERIFELVEGTSSKFWAITVEGTSHTVRFGRIGTTGQTKTKEFASDAAAKADADKLIAEKTGKGYVEKTAGAAPAPAAAPKPAPAKKSKKIAAPEEAVPVDEPVVVATPTPVRAEALTVTRRVDLDPVDRLYVTYQPRPSIAVPPPEPFDLEKCFKKLEKVKGQHGRAWSDAISFDRPISRQEAQFWIAVAELIGKDQLDLLKARRRFLTMNFDQEFTTNAVYDLLSGQTNYTAAMIALNAIIAWMTPEFFLELCSGDGGLPATGTHWYMSILPQRFHTTILPQLTDDQLARLRTALRPQVAMTHWPVGGYAVPPTAFYIAALCGMHREMEAIVHTLPDGMGADRDNYEVHYKHPQRIVFGLGSAELVVHHMRRLRLNLSLPEYVRAWLAHTGWSALDVVRDSVLAAGRKDEAAALVDELARVDAPELAPVMLELWLDSKAQAKARAWLADHPGNAIAGLMPLAGGTSKLGRAALDYLRELKRKDFASAIEEQLKAAPPELAFFVRMNVLEHKEKEYPVLVESAMTETLKQGFAEATAGKKSSLPAWADPAALPPILVGNAKLSDIHMRALLGALKAAPGGPEPLVTRALRKQAEVTTLDAFAWQLFELWMREGMPTKEKWAFVAMGLLGGDACALKLTPLVREWPGMSKHQTAALGLEVLRAIGTDTALMQLNGVAQKVKFNGIKTKAREMMDAIAADRGLTREQLEDRIVPDLDLDEHGGRTFDFGPRRFRMVLDENLAPLIRDADGKVKSDLPKPGTKDDATKAATAVAEWKLLKKQIKEVLKVQKDRLEQAMVSIRRWPVADFEALFVKHPLMTNLARRLVWAGYDAKGELARTFRVTDEKDYADAADKPLTLKGVETVGIVHPLHLDEPSRVAWGQSLGEYEIIPPFPQLGRPVNRLDPKDAGKTTPTLDTTRKIETWTMIGILDRNGWVRGPAQDGGCVSYHTKPFASVGVTAVLNYSGYPIGYADEDQTLQSAYFVPSSTRLDWWPTNEKALKLGTIDPVVLSEVISILRVLESKGK